MPLSDIRVALFQEYKEGAEGAEGELVECQDIKLIKRKQIENVIKLCEK